MKCDKKLKPLENGAQCALQNVVRSSSDNKKSSKKHKHCYKPVAVPPLYGGIIKHKWVCDCGKEC